MKTIIAICALIGALALSGCDSSSDAGGTSAKAIQGTWTLDPAVLEQFDTFKSLPPMEQATAKRAIQSMQGATMEISENQLYFKLSDKPGDSSTWDYTTAGKTGDTWTLDTMRYKGTSREQKSQMLATVQNGLLLLDLNGTPISFKKM